MDKFNYTPNSAAYTARDGNTVIGTELDGGMGRYRQDQINAAPRVQCQWVLESERDFRLWRAFYHGIGKDGAGTFLMDLIIDDEELTEYTCRFLPGTYNLNGISGPIHNVSAQIEVKPIPVEDGYYESLWQLNQAYGTLEDLQAAADGLSELVNIDLPSVF